MKSTKQVKDLEEIVKPYTFIPKVTLKGSVNGKNFYYPSGQPATLTYSEYEVLLNSDYAKELIN